MLQIIIQDILGYFCRYVKQGSRLAFLTFFLVFAVGNYYMKRHKRNEYHIYKILMKTLELAVLIFYCYVVLEITLLSRIGKYESVVNLRLFSTFNKAVVSPRYVYENILMMIPFAILLYLLAAPFRKIKISLSTGFFCSLAIEVVQLVTGLGHFIVDDILTNTIGMLIGYMACKLVTGIFHFYWKQKRDLQVKINKG